MKQEKTFIKTNIKTKSVILFLICAIFCIFVITACGSKDLPTSSTSKVNIAGNSQNTIKRTNSNLPTFDKNTSFTNLLPSKPEPNPTPEPTPTPKPNPTDPKLNFSQDSYLTLYTPWVEIVYDTSVWYTNVSWQDTNTLSQIWKDFINHRNDRYGRKWCIRDGDNRIIGDFKQGNYYYFDNNFDIVHAGKYADGLKVKKFLGGVIVKYSGGRESGTLTVGGLYQTLLNKDKNNSQGQQGYAKYNNNNLNEFMRAIHNREEGDLSIILMNVGYDEKESYDEYGIDEYYSSSDNNYRRNPEYFLGKNPDTYLGKSGNGWSGEKLNVRVNHSWNLSRFNFTFIYK